MIHFFNISWAQYHYIWALPIIIIAAIMLAYAVRKRAYIVRLLCGVHRENMIGYSLIKQIIKAVLLSLALFFLWIALMRPQWRKRNVVVAQEGRDLLIALDISRSMLATDVAPNRLDRAKQKIKELLAMLPCERVGLILFSGSAFVQCPLTNDYSAFYMFLDHVDAETISSGTTALDAAIKRSLDIYKDVAKKTKLLVIFTDGEDFSSNLKQYKTKAHEEGLHIFTIGVGTTEGAPVPLYDEEGKKIGYQKDRNGNVVITKLNEGILRTLAQDAGGVYIPLTKNDQDIKTLVNRISRYEKEKFEDKKIAQFDDTYHYFLAISFILLGLEWLL